MPACTTTAQKPPGGLETILLVEDEWAVRMLARQILEYQGYRVLDAASGREALPIWNQHAPHIDLLLTDLVMPDGLNGLQLADQLLAHKPSLRIVLTSGCSEENLGRELAARTGMAFLQKPYRADLLAQAVRACLDETELDT
jgi:two-component system, cell cycle sensor histidine kinase and response regulator CckA